MDILGALLVWRAEVLSTVLSLMKSLDALSFDIQVGSRQKKQQNEL